MAVKISGVTNSWKIGLVEHVDYEVAHGDHIVPTAGRFEVKLVPAGKHDVTSKCLHFCLLDMLACLPVHHTRNKSKVDKTYRTILKNIGAVIDIIRIWELVTSLHHEIV